MEWVEEVFLANTAILMYFHYFSTVQVVEAGENHSHYHDLGYRVEVRSDGDTCRLRLLDCVAIVMSQNVILYAILDAIPNAKLPNAQQNLLNWIPLTSDLLPS